MKPAIKRDDMAVRIDTSIDKAKYLVVEGFLKIGILLKEMRDERYYEELGHRTFTEYLESKDFSRVSAYKCINIHDLYVEKLGVPEERLMQIGVEKLNLIKDIVETDADEWLSKSQVLSTRDLKYEVKRVSLGLPEKPEEITRLQNLMMPKLEKVAAQVPAQYWSKIYYREPAPGVLECIVRISINEKENDD